MDELKTKARVRRVSSGRGRVWRQKSEWAGLCEWKSKDGKQVGVAEAWGSRGLDRALVEQGIAGPWNPQNTRSQDVPTPRLRELNG